MKSNTIKKTFNKTKKAQKHKWKIINDTSFSLHLNGKSNESSEVKFI